MATLSEWQRGNNTCWTRCRRLPKLYNLRMDLYERADITSNTYWDGVLQRAFLAVPTQELVAQFIVMFKDFRPR